MNHYTVMAVFLTMLMACASGTLDVPQDTLLADQGYQEMLKGNYERAEANLQVALSINPNNPYALLNLGVLYQNTGRLERAREMYLKLIELNPHAVAVRSTSSKYEGTRLVEIAKENMAVLGFPQK